MARVDELLRRAGDELASVSDTARLDAELLLAGVLSCNRAWLYTWPEHEPDAADEQRFREWVAERARAVPVAHLLGTRDFFDHRFRVTPDSLIPRPDTELLVEVALDVLPADGVTLADLGTGCGNVGISLALARPGWRLILTDSHEPVLDLARDNARTLAAGNVIVRQSDWLRSLPGPLDAVVSNPPYVPEADQHLDAGDLRHEPRSALVAGTDGLDAIRAIIAAAPERLVARGWLALEHGHDQGEAVRALMASGGFSEIDTRRDLAGQERVTHGRLRLQ